MARLTRTQKYAELRGKINQDRELSVSTNDLEKFADKLRNIEETAVQNIENEVKTIVEKETKVEKEVPSFSVPSFQNLNINAKEDSKPAIEEKIKSVEEMIEEMVSGVEKSIREIKPEQKEETTEEPIFQMVKEEEPVEKEMVQEFPEAEDDFGIFLKTMSEDLTENDVKPQVEDTAQLDDIFAIFNKVKEENKEEVKEEDIFASTTTEESIQEDTSVVEAKQDNELEKLIDEDTEEKTEADAPVEDVEEKENPQDEEVGEDIAEETNEEEDKTTEEISEEQKDISQEENFVEESPVQEIVEEEKEEEQTQEDIQESAQTEESTEENIQTEQVQETEVAVMETQDLEEDLVEEDSVSETPVEAKEEENLEVSEDTEPVAEAEFETDTKQQDVDVKIEDIISNIKNDINAKEDLESTQENMIGDILKEVNEYNQSKDRQDISEITTSIIEEVRHPEPSIEQNEEDKEFSDTVTLEIDKVLKEINLMNDTVDNRLDDVVVEEVAQEDTNSIDEKLLINNNNTVEDKTDSGEPIIIKNISETLSMEPSIVSNVLQDTKAFDISSTNEYEDDVYVDENDGAGKILNIILGVLIVVLIMVLAVIVYYILVARGIIG